jgi:hypothetical protein
MTPAKRQARVRAPEFPSGSWFNVAEPLRQLRGKVVLLDFWTFCCVNCWVRAAERYEMTEDSVRAHCQYSDEY